MVLNRHFCSLTALAAAIMLFLTACTGSSVQKDNPAKLQADAKTKTVLRFISSWGGVDSKAETLKSVLNGFVKDNPDIEVLNESLFGEDFLPKLKTDFASGNNPDVFGLWPGSDINELIKAGKVADLTGVLEADPAWMDSFDPKMWAYTTYDGKIYGLPVEVIFECLFVNRDLFNQYWIKVPRTFNELKDAVKRFRSRGIIPIAFNTYSEGTYLYQNMVASMGGKQDTENPFDGVRVKKCYIDAMKYVKELYDMDAFPQDCFTITNNERNVMFKEKKAAMIVQGSWYIGDFQPDDDKVDIIPFPSMTGGDGSNETLVYGLGGGSFHMSSSAASDKVKSKAAIRLLKALTSDKTASVFASETGMISNVNIEKYNIKYRKMTLTGIGMISKATMLVGPPDSFVDRSSWEDIISGQFPYFLEGKISAEELWADAIKNGIIPK